MIDAVNVVKRFDGFAALNHFNMHVPDGSVYGLIGPNGAGKSTIIRHVTGIYRPDSGEVSIDGRPVYENNDIKKRIGYIADEVFYFPQATTADMARFYQGIYPRFDPARFEKLKAAFEISADQPIRKLSRGQQKQSAWTGWTPSCAGRSGACCWTKWPQKARPSWFLPTICGNWRMSAITWGSFRTVP